MDDFKCTKCGACCWIIGCSSLDPKTNLCKIYEKRPQVCIGDEKTNNYKACKQCREIQRMYRRKSYKPPQKCILEIINLFNDFIETANK